MCYTVALFTTRLLLFSDYGSTLSRYTLVSHFLVKVESLRIEISRPRETFLNQGKDRFAFVIISWSVHHNLGMPVAVGMLFTPSGRNHIVNSIWRAAEMNTRNTDTVDVDRLRFLVGRRE